MASAMRSKSRRGLQWVASGSGSLGPGEYEDSKRTSRSRRTRRAVAGFGATPRFQKQQPVPVGPGSYEATGIYSNDSIRQTSLHKSRYGSEAGFGSNTPRSLLGFPRGSGTTMSAKKRQRNRPSSPVDSEPGPATAPAVSSFATTSNGVRNKSFGTTARFHSAQRDVPGPGEYSPKPADAPATPVPTIRRPRSSAAAEQRKLWNINDSPGPGAYNAEKPARSTIEKALPFPTTSRFGSVYKREPAPGPGAYNVPATTRAPGAVPFEGRASHTQRAVTNPPQHLRATTATQSSGAHGSLWQVPDTPGPGHYASDKLSTQSRLSRKASTGPHFGSLPRFPSTPTTSVGPGSYDPMRAIKRLDAMRGYTPVHPDEREPEHVVGARPRTAPASPPSPRVSRSRAGPRQAPASHNGTMPTSPISRHAPQPPPPPPPVRHAAMSTTAKRNGHHRARERQQRSSRSAGHNGASRRAHGSKSRRQDRTAQQPPPPPPRPAVTPVRQPARAKYNFDYSTPGRPVPTSRFSGGGGAAAGYTNGYASTSDSSDYDD